jgi:hypothetical protein
MANEVIVFYSIPVAEPDECSRLQRGRRPSDPPLTQFTCPPTDFTIIQGQDPVAQLPSIFHFVPYSATASYLGPGSTLLKLSSAVY